MGMTARKQSLTLATGANGLDLSAASAGGFRGQNVGDPFADFIIPDLSGTIKGGAFNI